MGHMDIISNFTGIDLVSLKYFNLKLKQLFITFQYFDNFKE